MVNDRNPKKYLPEGTFFCLTLTGICLQAEIIPRRCTATRGSVLELFFI
jgi:hypothetical protein